MSERDYSAAYLLAQRALKDYHADMLARDYAAAVRSAVRLQNFGRELALAANKMAEGHAQAR